MAWAYFSGDKWYPLTGAAFCDCSDAGETEAGRSRDWPWGDVPGTALLLAREPCLPVKHGCCGLYVAAPAAPWLSIHTAPCCSRTLRPHPSASGIVRPNICGCTENNSKTAVGSTARKGDRLILELGGSKL